MHHTNNTHTHICTCRTIMVIPPQIVMIYICAHRTHDCVDIKCIYIVVSICGAPADFFLELTTTKQSQKANSPYILCTVHCYTNIKCLPKYIRFYLAIERNLPANRTQKPKNRKNITCINSFFPSLCRYPFNDSEHASLFAKISRGQFLVPDCLTSKARCMIRSLLRKEPDERILSEDILLHPWMTQEDSRYFNKSSGDQMVPDVFIDDATV